MITAYPVLSQRMKEHGVSAKELAAYAGMSRVAFYLKMWGVKRWRLTDTVRICCFFRTPNAEHLFVRDYNKQQFLESQEENGNVL